MKPLNLIQGIMKWFFIKKKKFIFHLKNLYYPFFFLSMQKLIKEIIFRFNKNKFNLI